MATDPSPGHNNTPVENSKEVTTELELQITKAAVEATRIAHNTKGVTYETVLATQGQAAGMSLHRGEKGQPRHTDNKTNPPLDFRFVLSSGCDNHKGWTYSGGFEECVGKVVKFQGKPQSGENV